LKYIICSYSWLLFDPPIYNLGTLLASRGHQVLAIGISRECDPHLENIVPGFDVVRVRPPGHSLFKNFPEFLSVKYIWKLCTLANRLKPDYIIAGNWNSFIAAFIASSFSRSPIVYYQLEYNDRSVTSQRRQKWGSRFILKLERTFIGRAKKVFSAEMNRSRLMKRDYNLSYYPAPICNSPLLSSSSRLQPEFRSGPLRLVYAGSISRKAGIAALLRTVRSACGVKLTIYGPIDPEFQKDFDILFSEANQTELKIEYLGVIPYRQVASALQNHDVGVVFYQPTNLNQLFCSPCKLFEYMSAGLAILASNSPSLMSIVNDDQIGICVDSRSDEQLLNAVNTLVNDRDLTLQMCRKALIAFRDKYNYDIQVQPLLESLEHK
jgi:glycosyltransferase involved in cell wall biosynthesis